MRVRVLVAALCAGCHTDLILAAGDLTGILVAPATDAVHLAAPPPEAAVAEPMVAETAPPVDALASADVAADAAATPPPGGYNPVSTPQGPRENEGVRWEGVHERGGARQTMRGAGHDEEFKNRVRPPQH